MKKVSIHQLILDYNGSQQQKLAQFFAHPSAYDAPEEIHQMRLAIKKMRAITRILPLLFPNFPSLKSEQRILQKLFRPAGRLRDIQVQKTLLPELEAELESLFPSYLDFLNRAETHAQATAVLATRYYANIPFIQLQQKTEHHLEATAETLTKTRLTQLLRQHYKAIQKKTDQVIGERELHRIRRNLKETYYLKSLFAPILEEGDAIFPVPAKGLKNLEQQIGLWHDYVNTLIFLAHFQQTDTGHNLMETETLETRAKQKKERLRSTIQEQIHSLFKQ